MRKLKFNLFFDDNEENINNLLIDSIINYLNNLELTD